MIGSLERGEREAGMANVRQLAATLAVGVTWLLDDAPAETPDSIANDAATPDGLRALAADHSLIAALAIQPAEWCALRSIQLPRPATKAGYTALLLTVRLISTGDPRTETSPHSPSA